MMVDIGKLVKIDMDTPAVRDIEAVLTCNSEMMYNINLMRFEAGRDNWVGARSRLDEVEDSFKTMDNIVIVPDEESRYFMGILEEISSVLDSEDLEKLWENSAVRGWHKWTNPAPPPKAHLSKVVPRWIRKPRANRRWSKSTGGGKVLDLEAPSYKMIKKVLIRIWEKAARSSYVLVYLTVPQAMPEYNPVFQTFPELFSSHWVEPGVISENKYEEYNSISNRATDYSLEQRGTEVTPEKVETMYQFSEELMDYFESEIIPSVAKWARFPRVVGKKRQVAE